MISKNNRDSRKEPRYCHRGMGEATSRLSNFFCRASTMAKSDSPDSGTHQVHSQQSRYDEVDVSRSCLVYLRFFQLDGILLSGRMLYCSIGDEAGCSSVWIRLVVLEHDAIRLLNRKQQDASGRQGMPALGLVRR